MHVYRVLRAGILTTLAFTLLIGSAWAADESDLAGRAAAWQEAFNSGDLEAVAAMYTEDGCRMPPNAETVDGRAAILENLRAAVDAGAAEIEITVTEAESVGDIGYGTGTYHLMAADGSDIDHGKWLNISKRIDGEWQTHCDIWNTDMPLPTP